MFKNACSVAVALALLSACGGSDTARQDAPAVTMGAMSSSSRAESPLTVVSSEPQAIFPGKFADYTVLRSGANVIVTEKISGRVVATLSAVQKLLFADLTVSTDKAGLAGQAYRLYQAAFDRVPDSAGLGFHIAALDGGGATLNQVAQGFIDSAEFSTRYGTLDNAKFLNQLYANILHRAPDPAGLAYWLNLLDTKAITRASVLSGFSESAENIAYVAAAINNGISYTPYVIAGNGSAATLTANGAKVAWNFSGKLDLVLRDGRGTEVPGGQLSCVATDPAKLTVTADCKSARGHRLGSQNVLVSGAGVSAMVSLKVVPQRMPLGTNGNSRAYNLVATDGNVLAWGYNNGGLIGQGKLALELSTLPLLVKNRAGDGPLTDIMSSSAGEYHTMAVAENGDVVGWAGTGTYCIRNPANDGCINGIVQASVGQANGTLLSEDGRVYTWGHYSGQGYEGESKYPNLVKHPSGTGPLTDIVSVSAGGHFALALSSNGKVYAWGRNPIGETGRGTTNEQEVLPAAVRIRSDNSELTNIVAISAGYRFSMALTADGKVYAWGNNDWGQLGQNTDTFVYPSAILVKDSLGTGILSNIVMVSAGGNHAYALDSSGRVLSWGYESNGELGEGANRRRSFPLRPQFVVGTDSTGELGDIVSIAAGYEHGIALRRDGAVLAWGTGFRGNLGRGGTNVAQSAVPKNVLNPAGTGPLMLPVASYPNLLNRGIQH